MIEKIRKSLEGKKTYLTGLATILGCIIAWINSGELNMNLIITALLGMFIRAGVTTVEK